MQKQFDSFEPYLEPLYIPAFFGLCALFLIYVVSPFDLGDPTIPALLIFFGMIIVSVLATIYELLLVFGLIRKRAYFSTQNKVYRYLRWAPAIFGLATMVFSFYFVSTTGVLVYGMRYGRPEGKG